MSNEWPENYVVKGLNNKFNYFVSRNKIYDLEFNIPLCEAVNSSLSVKDKSRFNKQNKIYVDSSRYLSIDFYNIIHFPITRMDILFMKNLKEDLKKSGPKAAKRMDIEIFSKVFDDRSLFHYFAEDFEVIDWVYR